MYANISRVFTGAFISMNIQMSRIEKQDLDLDAQCQVYWEYRVKYNANYWEYKVQCMLSVESTEYTVRDVYEDWGSLSAIRI